MGTNRERELRQEPIFRLVDGGLLLTHMDLPYREVKQSLRLFLEHATVSQTRNGKEVLVAVVELQKRIFFRPAQQLHAGEGKSERIQLPIYARAKRRSRKEEQIDCGEKHAQVLLG